MKRPITGFGIDDENDWFAYLSCGHRQHVRHRPPFVSRPWVTTRAGRNSRLGWPLDCVRCDRLEWPDNLVGGQHAGVFSQETLPQALARSHVDAADTWVQIVVTSGILHCRIEALDIGMRLSRQVPGIVPPRTSPTIDANEPVVIELETWQVPEPPADFL